MTPSRIAMAERLERRAGAMWHDHPVEAEHLVARASAMRISAGQSPTEAQAAQTEQVDHGYREGAA